MVYKFKIKFADNNELSNHLKWCRNEFGERGVQWDFHGGHRNAFVELYDQKLATFYSLKCPGEAC
jgi:hypothetical protein